MAAPRQDLGCSQHHCIDPTRLFSLSKMSQFPITPDNRELTDFFLPQGYFPIIFFFYYLTLNQRWERYCHCHYKLYLLIIHKSKHKRGSKGCRSSPIQLWVQQDQVSQTMLSAGRLGSACGARGAHSPSPASTTTSGSPVPVCTMD